MLRKGIPDIRLLRSTDARVRRQLRDLAPYRAVSSLPAARRDLSIAVGPNVDAELLGDRVRALPSDVVEAVEELAVVAATPYGALPPTAVARIGIRPGQRNVLVRLLLRHPTRTLTAADANRIRNRVYAALHEGDVHQWAS
jgi:phenylalanyl-tRNA synthetase alpha chain